MKSHVPRENRIYPIALTPSQQRTGNTIQLERFVPRVRFLDTTPIPSEDTLCGAPIMNVKLTQFFRPHSPPPCTYCQRPSSLVSGPTCFVSCTTEYEQPTSSLGVPPSSSSDMGLDTDMESTNVAGSTFTEPMAAGMTQHQVDSSDNSSSVTPVKLARDSKSQSFRASSRALRKEHFISSEPLSLPPGHPTIAFTEDHVSSVLRVVTNETARAFHYMLENLIQRASLLRLESQSTQPKTGTKTEHERYGGDNVHCKTYESTGHDHCDTSGAFRSDDDFKRFGYSYKLSYLNLAQ